LNLSISRIFFKVENIMVYMIEAICLGIFMVVATLTTTALQLPASPLHQAIEAPLLRRLLIGIVIGITAITIIYSPWGKRSGAHLNPAVTLTFWRLKKIRTTDAAIYILAQCLGGICGIWVVGLLIGETISNPAINYIVTVLDATGSKYYLRSLHIKPCHSITDTNTQSSGKLPRLS
jgi:aquaporin Z